LLKDEEDLPQGLAFCHGCRKTGSSLSGRGERSIVAGLISHIVSSAFVNGGVKFGHCGGAKVGQFGASALERAALI